MSIPKLWLCQNCETLHSLSQLTCEVCGEDIPMEFRQPIISAVKTSSKQVRDNEFIVISWNTNFAKYVSLNGIHVSAKGSQEIPATEKVTLKASNSNGSIEKSINIKVIHVLEIEEFSINDKNIQYGNDCIISWKGRNIKNVFFEGKELASEGSFAFKPKESSNYEVLFEGTDGDSTIKSFDIHVFYPSPIINVKAPAFAKNGEIVHVEWNTEHVSSVTIDGIERSLTGSYFWFFSETAKEKSIFFLDMKGDIHEHKVTVKEASLPTILTFNTSAEEINDNELVILRWTTSNAKYVFLNGTRVSANGSKNLSAIENYTLKASNEFGSIERLLHVKVLHPVEITTFKVDQTNLNYGNPCVISWKGRNICKVTIDGQECNPISPLVFTPLESRTYVVTFEGHNGQIIEKIIDIDVTFPEPVCNIEASKYGKPGKMVKVEWKMENVKCVEIGNLKFTPNGSFEWEYAPEDCCKTLHIIGLDNVSFNKFIKIRAAHCPEISNILLSKDKFKIGDFCNLSWSGNYIDEWYIEGQSRQDGNLKTVQIKIESENIKIHFIGEDGTEITRDIEVYIVHDPEVIECKFSPEVPIRGQLTRIEWKTKHVKKVKIGKASFFPESHFEFVPYKNEDFEIRFIGEDKHIVKDMHVVFPKIKIQYFRSNSYNIAKGDACIISWSATNVTRVEIKGKRFSAINSFSYTPDSSEEVFADFIGEDGTTERRSINIVVTLPAIQIFDVSVSKECVKYGETVTLTWKSNHVNFVTISGINGQLPESGSKDIIIKENRRICFTFNGINGITQRKYLQISVKTPLQNARITTNKKEVYLGECCTVRWYADNAQSVVVNGIRLSMSDSYTFYPKTSESLKVIFYGTDGSSCERSIYIQVKQYTHSNNQGFFKFLLFLLILIIAFVTWTYFFRNDMYKEILYVINHFNIQRIINIVETWGNRILR